MEGADFEYEMSKTLSAPLAVLIVIRSQNRLPEEPMSTELKNDIIRQKETRLKQQVETIDEKLSPEMIKTNYSGSGKGGIKMTECIAIGGRGLHAHKGGVLGFVSLKVEPSACNVQILPCTVPCSCLLEKIQLRQTW